jgi:predicted lipoprotein with Yx(FWY)xxD motif
MRKALVILPATLVLAGCGAGSFAAAGHPASSAQANAAAKHTVIKTRHTALGTFLVDGSGRTLYLFRKDRSPVSQCTGVCAQDWPPVTTRLKPVAKGGAKASLLSTHRRAGGAKQVIYNGHPLYRFSGDTGPGTTSGQGLFAFGAKWFVVSPKGRPIRASAASAPAAASPAPYGTPTPTPYTY